MSDAKQSLNNFIARVKQKGLLTASHFYVIIPEFGQATDNKDLLMFCDAADIPGITLMTTEVRQYGEFTTMPHAPMYQPIQLQFICDSSMAVKEALESWIDSVFNRHTRSFNYYDSYTKNMQIIMTDKAGNDAHIVTLYEAYPTAIGNIQLDYSNESIVKVPVTIAYKWWKQQFLGPQYKGQNQEFLRTLPTSVPVFNGIIAPGRAYYFNGAAFDGFEFLSAFPTLSAESQGIFTGVTETGSLDVNQMDVPVFKLFSGSSSNDIMNFGYDLGNDFNRAGNGLSAAFMAAPVNTVNGSQFVQQMAVHAKSIASDMLGYSQGLIELGKDVQNIMKPASMIGTAITSVGGTLSAIDGTLQQLGIKSQPFSKVARELYSAGGKIGQVANLRGLSGGLQTVGANMTATSSIFQQVTNELQKNDGFQKQIDSAMDKMGRMFSINGSKTMNAANVLQVKSGEDE